MDRLNEKLDLLVKLGRLFGPMQRLAESPDEYDEQERAETIARYFSEHQLLIQDFARFSTGQPGHNYQIEYKKFIRALSRVASRLEQGHDLRQIVTEHLAMARDAINAVPVPRSSVILDAGTPFTAYCKLRSLCEADATRSIMWFDPYFGPEIFHRYLQFVNQDISIVLVVSEPGPHGGRRNTDRWDSFLDISRLLAHERGINSYRLLIANSLHDRWLVLDGKRIYALGGSAKDAASKDLFTITDVEASPDNLRKIDDTLSAATEWFGPSTPTHR
jgi:hypothetical protein